MSSLVPFPVSPLVHRTTIDTAFFRAFLPWEGTTATWHLRSDHQKPTRLRATITAVQTHGLLLTTDTPDPAAAWRVFVPYLDFWAQHVTVGTPALLDHDVRTTRSQLLLSTAR